MQRLAIGRDPFVQGCSTNRHVGAPLRFGGTL
jgi:hypothetical protein